MYTYIYIYIYTYFIHHHMYCRFYIYIYWEREREREREQVHAAISLPINIRRNCMPSILNFGGHVTWAQWIVLAMTISMGRGPKKHQSNCQGAWGTLKRSMVRLRCPQQEAHKCIERNMLLSSWRSRNPHGIPHCLPGFVGSTRVSSRAKVGSMWFSSVYTHWNWKTRTGIR